MQHTLVLFFAFGLIALFHYRAHERVSTLASSVPWIAAAGHPVTLDTIRDMLIHGLIYSNNAPIHWIS